MVFAFLTVLVTIRAYVLTGKSVHVSYYLL